MLARPSEAIQATVGSILGAVFILIGAFTDWEPTPEVIGAVTLLVSWIAVAVTWYVARKQRAGELASRGDGSVTNP